MVSARIARPVTPRHKRGFNADVRKARRWSGAADTPWATRLLVRRGLPTLGSRQSRGPVAICVFCVHPLVSAFESLLYDAADRCWQTYARARGAAQRSGAM